MRSRPGTWACALLALLLTGAGAALALDDPLLSEVLQEVAAGDLREARALLARGEGGGARGARQRELAELVIEVAELRAGSRPRAEVLAHSRALAARVEPSDLPLLRDGQRSLGSSRSYLAPLVRAAYRAIGPGLASETLLELGRDPERRVRTLAVSALAERLGPMRAAVTGGGCLSESQQSQMADPALIQLLIERLAERPAATTDRIPADLAARAPASATALHALVLVEAAALPLLQSLKDQAGVQLTIAAIHSAVTRRLRRYPESTWFCADGQHLRSHGAALEHCEQLLASSARFCPHCGTQVKRACATCGELSEADAEFCPSCGAAASDPAARCSRCQAALPPQTGFCPQCGDPVSPQED